MRCGLVGLYYTTIILKLNKESKDFLRLFSAKERFIGSVIWPPIIAFILLSAVDGDSLTLGGEKVAWTEVGLGLSDVGARRILGVRPGLSRPWPYTP